MGGQVCEGFGIGGGFCAEAGELIVGFCEAGLELGFGAEGFG